MSSTHTIESLDNVFSDAESFGGISAELKQYIETALQFFLATRGSLQSSSIDMLAIACCYEDGIELNTLLRGMQHGVGKLREKRQPLNSVSQLMRWIKQEHQRLQPSEARRSSRKKSDKESKPVPAVATILRAMFDEYSVKLRGVSDVMGYPEHPLVLELISGTMARVAEIQEQAETGPLEAVARLVGVGRSFYQELIRCMPEDVRQGLRDEAARALNGYKSFSMLAREETINEFCVQLLRNRLQLFEPAPLIELMDALSSG